MLLLGYEEYIMSIEKILLLVFVVLVVVIEKFEDVVFFVCVFYNGGLKVLEIILWMLIVVEVVKFMKEVVFEVYVGIGIVIDKVIFNVFVEVGVDFMVSLGVNDELLVLVKEFDILFLFGVVILSEVMKLVS